MLGRHPDVLSLFEFFTGLDWGKRFAADPIGGGEFRALVAAEQPFVTAVMRRGYPVEEITYPFDSADGVDGAGRYRRDDPLPWILVSMLPRLTDDPDSLYDELVRELDVAPSMPPIDHYRRMFGWLGRRLGRAHWIERSGSSIEYVDELARLFTNARFVHLHRAGPEVALSMREHHAYRLPICLLYGAPLDDGTPISELGDIDVNTVPSGDDPISRILASRPSAEYFGRYWNDQVVKGMAAVAAIPAERVLSVPFSPALQSFSISTRRLTTGFAAERPWCVVFRRRVLTNSVPRSEADSSRPVLQGQRCSTVVTARPPHAVSLPIAGI
jgi:hypothetical protein